jgi:hypothetical protein
LISHSSDSTPPQNPFATEAFARLWEGWHGRRVHHLEAGEYGVYFVSHRRGLARTLDALPFGIPAFVHDRDSGARTCIERFFALRSLRSTLSLFTRPTGWYAHVSWREQMRSVVTLAEGWPERVDADVQRRSQRALRDGWEVRELEPGEWDLAQQALFETDRRHGADPRFDIAFFRRLHELHLGREGLHLPAALRAGKLGALHVILAAGGYEVSWFLLATDQARAEGVVPALQLAWLEQCAARQGKWADLGASPSASVQRFKASFGATMIPYYSGTRRWAILGRA